MNIVLSAAVQQRIIAHLQSTYPNEGGGFLLGTPSAEGLHISDAIAIDNVFESAEQYHRYAMTPQNWARMEDEADARGLTLVGYFHSHPDSPAIPSEFDRDHALPNFVYIITQVNEAQAVAMFAYLLRASREAFDTLDLVIA